MPLTNEEIRNLWKDAAKTAEAALEPHTPERYCTPNEGYNFARLYSTAFRQLTSMCFEFRMLKHEMNRLKAENDAMHKELAQAGLRAHRE